MKKRQLGTSDLHVSELGFGCMSLGTDETEALRIMDEVLELGINYLDTADLYNQGLNEKFVGKALKGRRQDVILATKVGNRFEQGKEGWWWDPSKAYIKEAVKDSLKRLQTDYIDLYQLHGGTIDDPIDETIEAFEELKQEGIIRYYGISSIRPNVIKEYLKRSNIVSIMMQYSILDRRPEEWFPLIQEHGVSVVVRGPVARGLLSNRPLPEGEGYLHYRYDELKSLRESLPTNRPLHELALQYCLAHDVVATVAAGASSIDQVKANVQAVEAARLTPEERQHIQKLAKAAVYEQHRM